MVTSQRSPLGFIWPCQCSRSADSVAMHKAVPLHGGDDHDPVHAELLRRSKEKEFQLILEIAEKYFLPDIESTAGLTFRLANWQSVQSDDSKIWSYTGNELLIALKCATAFRERVDRALEENNTAFLQRLLNAGRHVADGNFLDWKLTVTGYVFAAWLRIGGQVGRRPDMRNLKLCVKRLRKEDGLPAEFDRKQWRQALKDLEPLFSHRF